MRRLASLAPALLGAVLVLPLPATAQVPEAPVRYEDDFPGPDFHRSRRAALMDALPSDGLALLFSAPQRNRSNDTYYEYRQASDFLYLTGSDESGSALLLAPGGVEIDGRRVREVLFVPPRDPAQEVWLGRRFGAERAMAELGIALAVDADRFDEIVAPLLSGGAHQVFHLPLPDGVERDSPLAGQLALFAEHTKPLQAAEAGLAGFMIQGILGADSPAAFDRVRVVARQQGFGAASVSDPELREVTRAFLEARDYPAWVARRNELLGGRPDGVRMRAVLDELRQIKTEAELVVLRRAIDITADAHRQVMQQVEPGWAEYEIEALIEYTFKRSGAEHPGFPSIVGSAENSVVLHYETNRRTTRPGDVVVIDIGAEVHGYSADVTRTIPVDGRFSPEQRTIYDLVYRAQEAGIRAARAGQPFGAPHQAAARVIAEGLAELGLISGANDSQGIFRFFMHGTSHYLGLDVHDVGTYGPLEPGTVITVEPGIYIAAAEDIDPKWWNIGVRIEDDVLITDSDPVILSVGAPRRAQEIEALMAGSAASR